MASVLHSNHWEAFLREVEEAGGRRLVTFDSLVAGNARLYGRQGSSKRKVMFEAFELARGLSIGAYTYILDRKNIEAAPNTLAELRESNAQVGDGVVHFARSNEHGSNQGEQNQDGNEEEHDSNEGEHNQDGDSAQKEE